MAKLGFIVRHFQNHDCHFQVEGHADPLHRQGLQWQDRDLQNRQGDGKALNRSRKSILKKLNELLFDGLLKTFLLPESKIYVSFFADKSKYEMSSRMR